MESTSKGPDATVIETLELPFPVTDPIKLPCETLSAPLPALRLMEFALRLPEPEIFIPFPLEIVRVPELFTCIKPLLAIDGVSKVAESENESVPFTVAELL